MPGLSSWVVWTLLLVSWAVFVSSSDVNWGKKVPCFRVDGTVVCPGCNYRAGLSCPRALKNSRNCLVPSTEPPYRYPPTPSEPITTKPDEYPTTTVPETTYEKINVTVTTNLSSSTESPESNEILHTKYPMDGPIHFYPLLGHKIQKSRYAREAELEQMVQKEEEGDDALEEEEEEEACDWNADCACPLICCKTGPGCPKKCVMGIRLPPPWG